MKFSQHGYGELIPASVNVCNKCETNKCTASRTQVISSRAKGMIGAFISLIFLSAVLVTASTKGWLFGLNKNNGNDTYTRLIWPKINQLIISLSLPCWKMKVNTSQPEYKWVLLGRPRKPSSTHSLQPPNWRQKSFSSRAPRVTENCFKNFYYELFFGFQAILNAILYIWFFLVELERGGKSCSFQFYVNQKLCFLFFSFHDTHFLLLVFLNCYQGRISISENSWISRVRDKLVQ